MLLYGASETGAAKISARTWGLNPDGMRLYREHYGKLVEYRAVVRVEECSVLLGPNYGHSERYPRAVRTVNNSKTSLVHFPDDACHCLYPKAAQKGAEIRIPLGNTSGRELLRSSFPVHFLNLAATSVWYHQGRKRWPKLKIGPNERFYELNQDGLRNAPSGLGVYVLYTDKNVAVFVGADVDIYARLAWHLHDSDPCIGQNSPTKFQWAPVNPSLLEATKQKWIDALNPLCL